MAAVNSEDALRHQQVMGAQVLHAQAANGVIPEGQNRAVEAAGSQDPPAEDSAIPTTSGSTAYGTMGATASVGATAVLPEVQTSVPVDIGAPATAPPVIDAVSALGQAGQQRPTTILEADGNLQGGMSGGGAGQSASQMGFYTPRSSTSQNNWLQALEMPRWVSRLGNYLSTGYSELAPSPLVAGRNSPPQGVQPFALRSPSRQVRAQRTATPPSTSSIPAEAIEAEVQRQLGGLLGRLRIAEERNAELTLELQQARQDVRENQGPRAPSGRVGDGGPLLGDLASGPLGPSGVWSRVEHAGPALSRGDPLTALRSPELGEGDQPQPHTLPPIAPFTTTYGDTQEGNPRRNLSEEFGGQQPREEAVPRPGLLRQLLGPRPRSQSPDDRRPPQESSVLQALTQGVRQLQELQAQAMSKSSTTSTSEVVKSGATALLPLPGVSDPAEAALAFQDWVEVSSTTMGDISERSGSWWASVVQIVEKTYAEWLSATPLERLAVNPPQDHGLCTGAWSRLNARSASMLLASMDDEVKNEMVALRVTQDSVKMLFRLYVRFQPGGAAERSDVLTRLQSPGDYVGTDDLDHVLKAIRAWPRWLARCRAVRMEPPDPTVLAKGLLSLTDRYISTSADSSFRTATLRTSLRLDAQPTLQQVQAYQKHLQAELEVIAASTRSTTTGNPPKIRAVETSTSPTKTRDKDRGSELCRYFAKPSGCKRGEKCTYSHSMASLDREARSRKCLKCGSESHRQRECPVGKSGPRVPPTTTPTAKDGKGTSGPSSSSTTRSTMAPMTASSPSTASSTLVGTPWTLEALMQAAQQVVQSQGVGDGGSSPEKTSGTQMKTLRINNIHVCTTGRGSAALLDSGATHCLRSAYNDKEWNESEEILVELAGGSSLVMRMGTSGSLLMRRELPRLRTGAQTIVPVGQLVRVLGYTLIWGPGKCFLVNPEGEQVPLSTSGGCPQLCEAEALSMIARIEDLYTKGCENGSGVHEGH